jgi:spore germination protein GerM
MKKKRTSIGCLFWIALILLVLVVFLFNKKQIDQVVRSTGLLDLLRREKPEAEGRGTEGPEVTRVEIPAERSEEPSQTEDLPLVPETASEDTPIEGPGADEIPVVKTEPQSVGPQPEREKKMRKSTLYFVRVDDSGGIHMIQVTRPVYYVDSPLTETMKALISALLPEEIDKGYQSLIPSGTTILSITVKDGTATIDFNENFRFNPFGTEGSISQLRQIVYTATEFPTVKRVRFLIEGQPYTYLTPEGIDISKPLGRDSFK